MAVSKEKNTNTRRNPDYRTKSHVAVWFKENPSRLEPVENLIKLLGSYYVHDSNHGYINKKDENHYLFGPSIARLGGADVTFSKSHTIVRFWLDGAKKRIDIPKEGKRKQTIKSAKSENLDAVDFKIETDADFEVLRTFLSKNQIPGWSTVPRILNKATSKNKQTISDVEAAKLAKDVDDSDADEAVKNEIRREIWCRTPAHAQFRKKLINERGGQCALTGMKDVDGHSLLVASHIKPWAACRDEPHLQTDINNGLILCIPIDKLFDRGYLTFNDDGSVELHKEGHDRCLGEESLAVFGLNTANMPKIKQPLTAKTKEFLEYHRDNVFNRD